MRHNRLWSIAGISQGLSLLNEIELPNIAKELGGKVMVAGGGKFTAFFGTEEAASDARQKMIEKITTSFPMLEFQISPVIGAETFAGAKAKGIIDNLNNEKQRFRGYGVSFLPHMAVCVECGEYPAEERGAKDPKKLCRTCQEAWDRAYTIKIPSGSKATTLQRIYRLYFEATHTQCRPPFNFDDLFADGQEATSGEDRQRMAVWFSDLNNMNSKVPIWLAQKDEEIYNIFEKVKNANIAVVSDALIATFPNPAGSYLPFRLVVAGGDDLCLVMAEENILTFAKHLDAAVRTHVDRLDEGNPLNMQWLRGRAIAGKEIGPYSFGASFVITSTHTPFRLIHEVGETLMKCAKEETGREGNSINWRIRPESEDDIADQPLEFERPLFIVRPDSTMQPGKPPAYGRLSLLDYLTLRDKYSSISKSHRFAIIAESIELRAVRREEEFEDWLKCFDASDRDKSFSGLLTEPLLRRGKDGPLLPARIATLFELLSIKTSPQSSQQEEKP